MNIEGFKELPIIGILRGIEESCLELLVEAVVSSGLKSIEITMNTEGATSLIKEAIRLSKGRLTVGAGTVVSMDDLKQALDSGATYVVMPTLIEPVVEYCAKANIPVFPGALTPQEIHDAWEAGATMVKVFPAKFFGPAYFKEIKGPFSEIELLACGGVNSGNISTFFENGASAVAFGGSIFKQEYLREQTFDKIKEAIESLVKGFLNTKN